MSKIDRLRVAAVQRGGGCEIRTREGLPPTRLPTMLTGVHRRSPPSPNCANGIWLNIGEQLRTGMNETKNEAMLASSAFPPRPAGGTGVRAVAGAGPDVGGRWGHQTCQH